MAAAKAKDKAGIRAALAKFQGCANDLPGHAGFHSAAGWAQLRLGDRVAARKSLETAVGLNQANLEPELMLARLDLAEGRHGDALKHADRGLELLPAEQNYMCVFIRAEALHGMGDSGAAQEEFSRVLQLAPEESHEYQEASRRLGKPEPAAPAPDGTSSAHGGGEAAPT